MLVSLAWRWLPGPAPMLGQEREHAARIDQVPDHAGGVQERAVHDLATLHKNIPAYQHKPFDIRHALFSGLLEALDDENLDAVLINIARISQLRDAYPNYFADTGRFTEFVRTHLDGRLPQSA
jgi:hypothetical protein